MSKVNAVCLDDLALALGLAQWTQSIRWICKGAAFLYKGKKKKNIILVSGHSD